MALFAIVYVSFKRLGIWKKCDLDVILMNGDQLYRSLDRTDYLTVTYFPETFQVGSVQVNIEYNINKHGTLRNGTVSAEEFVGNKVTGRILKREFQENKARQIFRKTYIFYPLICTRTCAYQGVKNVCFCGKFGVLCFLETPVLRSALLPYYRRIIRDFQISQ